MSKDEARAALDVAVYDFAKMYGSSSYTTRSKLRLDSFIDSFATACVEDAQQRIDTLDKCLKEALYQAELEAQRAEAAEAENRRLRSMIMGMLEAPIFKEVERLRAELDQRQSTSTKKRKARVTRHSPGMISIRTKEEE